MDEDLDLLQNSPLLNAKEGTYATRAIKAETHSDGSHSVEYQVEEQFFDDNEQNLEEEATAMLDVWNNISTDKSDLLDLNPLFSNQDDEDDDDCGSFDAIQEKMTSIHEDQVFIKIVHSNPGGKPVTHYSSVLYDVVGYLEYNDNPFDNSISRGVPMFHRLHKDIVLPGIKIGLMHMRQGEKAQILIKPKYAFRELGCPPRVPANSTVLFSVILHKTWEESALDDYLDLDAENQAKVTYNQRYEMCLKHKEAANQFYKDMRLKEALIRYKAAIKCLDDFPSVLLADQSSKEAKLITILLQNAMVIYNKLRMPRAATKAAKRLLERDPKNLKALHGMCKARICLGDYDEALIYINKATEVAPDHKDFNNLKSELDFQKREDRRRSEELMMKMSKVFA